MASPPVEPLLAPAEEQEVEKKAAHDPRTVDGKPLYILVTIMEPELVEKDGEKFMSYVLSTEVRKERKRRREEEEEGEERQEREAEGRTWSNRHFTLTFFAFLAFNFVSIVQPQVSPEETYRSIAKVQRICVVEVSIQA